MYNVKVVLNEKFQGDIPQTIQCLDFLKDIWQRGFLQLKGSQGQQRGVLFVARTKRGRRQCSGGLIVRPVCMLRVASRHTTQSSTIKVKFISFTKPSVYNEYSLKVSLKSYNYWESNAHLKQFSTIKQKFKSPGRKSSHSTAVTRVLNDTTLMV